MKVQKYIASAASCTVFLFCLLISSSFAGDATSGLGGLADTASSIAGSSDISAPLDINSASSELLAQIPGIGPELGQAITAYRDTNGNFSGLSDLLKIDGIDAGLLEKIKPFLSF